MVFIDKRWIINIYKTLAVPLIYNRVWPNAETKIFEDSENDINQLLDIGGADLILSWEPGNYDLIAQIHDQGRVTKPKEGYDVLNLPPDTLLTYFMGNRKAKKRIP